MIWNIEILATQQQNDGDAFELLPLFSSELTKSVAKFRDVSISGCSKDGAHLCHRMRGSAAVFGFSQLAAILLISENLLTLGEITPSLIAVELTAVAEQIAIRVENRAYMA